MRALVHRPADHLGQELALVDSRVESAKLFALVLAGGALRLSWRRAGTVVQAFFLGNVLPMMAVAGLLFQDATSRLCNAYRLDDQQFLGLALAWLAPVIFAGWLLSLRIATESRPLADDSHVRSP